MTYRLQKKIICFYNSVIIVVMSLVLGGPGPALAGLSVNVAKSFIEVRSEQKGCDFVLELSESTDGPGWSCRLLLWL